MINCVHGLDSQWCADCLGLKDSEEEATESDMGIVDNFSSWRKDV